ncbi:hypothetical protein fugu_008682 [Takifugu bimaculatus]|uniref:RecA family profile 1 domain-containing protein n=1 Tax=Takifugu bimaculatus TaxID=433685 RepID=A0A4Z2AWM1_9TELE|nr:hypothetical protein fugu_008682 [Takifugu bimaculatus]
MVVLREGMCPGLDEDLVRDLRNADIKTVEDLVSSDTEKLAQKCSVSYKALLAIRRVLLAQHTAFPVLDKLLDSGFYTGELTELSGGPGSGKSQRAHLPPSETKRGVRGHDWGPDQPDACCRCWKLKPGSREEQMEALQRIHVFRLFDVFSLLDCLYGLRAGILQQVGGGGSVKAVIVDSVSAVIAPVLGGKQNEGMSLMTQVGGVLKTIAKDFNIAALVTNHVTRSLSGEVQPGLGMSWSHVPRTRILLERVEAASAGCSSLRSATLIKSSRQPCNIRVEFDLHAVEPLQTRLGGDENTGGDGLCLITGTPAFLSHKAKRCGTFVISGSSVVAVS